MATPPPAPRILLVEDEPSVRDLLSRFLTQEGYWVLTASNGATALEVSEQSSPDLIILDLHLPILDGPQFVRAYRHRPGPHAPILAITGLSYTAEQAAALDLAGYLEKPLRLAELRAQVADLIGPPRPPLPANARPH